MLTTVAAVMLSCPAIAAQPLTDAQMDRVTAGDLFSQITGMTTPLLSEFVAGAQATAMGAVTVTMTSASVFPTTLGGNPVTGSSSASSSSSYSPP